MSLAYFVVCQQYAILICTLFVFDFVMPLPGKFPGTSMHVGIDTALGIVLKFCVHWFHYSQTKKIVSLYHLVS